MFCVVVIYFSIVIHQNQKCSTSILWIYVAELFFCK